MKYIFHGFSGLTGDNPLAKSWSGGAMVQGRLPVPGRPTIWMTVEQGPIVLAVVRMRVV